jgi:hypothetical protein
METDFIDRFFSVKNITPYANSCKKHKYKTNFKITLSNQRKNTLLGIAATESTQKHVA